MGKRSRLRVLEERLDTLEKSQEIAHLGSWRAAVGPESLLELSGESRRILGLEDGTPVRNIDFFNLVHPEDRDQLIEMVMEVRTESSRRDVELRLADVSRGERLVLVTAAPLTGEGAQTMIMGTLQEVTRRGHDRLDPEAERRRALEWELRRALEDGDLFLEYQPVMSLEHEEYVGAEALVRWRHAERGVLKPREFIEVAEETGLIVPLGAFVLSSACQELRRWLDRGLREDFTMAINVSPRQLRSEGFPTTLSLALSQARIVASSVLLELTESTLVEGAVDEGVLHEIRGLGVRIAIDDFGTKYSSLNYLTRLPINTLKVDESFVRDIHDVAGRAVVTTIAALGNALGLGVTAEGVETAGQLTAIREVGCDAAQGYLISPSLGAEECLAFVTSPRIAG